MRRPRPLVWTTLVALVLGALQSPLAAQTPPLLVGMGDSIGEGVQSADASTPTQQLSYLPLLADLMGVAFPLPLIETGLLSSVGETSSRSQIDPSVEGLNLSVSGADVDSLLRDQADALTEGEIDNETDLVLYPRLGSQIEIVEALQPEYVVCWIGNNDALSAVTNPGQIDGVSGLTPLAQFTNDFHEIAARLDAIGAKVVFGTIPDVTKIGYLLDAQDLQRLLGSDYGLPPGHWTSLIVALGIRIGDLDPIAIQNPNTVLDPGEAASINQRIDEFNDVIRNTAAIYGFGVAETGLVFDFLHDNPLVLGGVPLTTRFLGGLFSLDGVHPSGTAHAILAQFFAQVLNAQYGLNIPMMSIPTFSQIFLDDPHIDKDGDGKVQGRFGAGLLETVSFFFGWSGDLNDDLP